MNKAIFFFCLFLSIIFAVFGRQIAASAINSWVRFTCERGGKEFLTQTNGKTVCVKKHEDAGKSCLKSEECKGYCIVEKPRPIGTLSGKQRGYYYLEATKAKGSCSEYDFPKGCYKEFVTTQTKIDFYDDKGLVLCPPTFFY